MTSTHSILKVRDGRWRHAPSATLAITAPKQCFSYPRPHCRLADLLAVCAPLRQGTPVRQADTEPPYSRFMATDAESRDCTLPAAGLEASLAVLTDPQRLGIIRALGFRPGMGSAELARWLDLPAPTVRKQLRFLMELDMVHVKEREARRGVQKLYFVNRHRPWVTFDGDSDLDSGQRRSVDFEILRALLADARRAMGADGYGSRPGRMVASQPATVDLRAWREISQLQQECLDRTVEIVEAGRARLAKGAEEPVMLTAALVLLEVPPPAEEDPTGP
jgi:DNA-binding transcriptional ArsR family regulator